MQEVDFKPELHVFICINDRNEETSCGPTIKHEDVKALKMWVVEKGLVGRVVCTRTGCLGFCNSEGGVIAMYPSGKFYKGLKNIDEIKELIEKTI